MKPRGFTIIEVMIAIFVAAIMFAIVLRYAIGSCRFTSASSTDMPCDCAVPHRRSSSRTMSLPVTQGRSAPVKRTRRCRAIVK